jgi:hypothetical protein
LYHDDIMDKLRAANGKRPSRTGKAKHGKEEGSEKASEESGEQSAAKAMPEVRRNGACAKGGLRLWAQVQIRGQENSGSQNVESC